MPFLCSSVRLVLAVPLSVCLMAISAGCRGMPRGERHASATLQDSSGRQVGTIRLTDAGASGVVVDASVDGLAAGQHGIHFHAVGQCVAAGAFSSAGGHANPTNRKHGLENPDGPHAGDLPNLVVGADQRGTLRVTTPRVTLGSGAGSLLDADGTAVVVHATQDDQRTDPAGNSGARVACGVVRRS
jgi:superoxide dismutase, Cu-Zn family